MVDRLAERRDRLSGGGRADRAELVNRQVERIRWRLAIEMARQDRRTLQTACRAS